MAPVQLDGAYAMQLDRMVKAGVEKENLRHLSLMAREAATRRGAELSKRLGQGSGRACPVRPGGSASVDGRGPSVAAVLGRRAFRIGRLGLPSPEIPRRGALVQPHDLVRAPVDKVVVAANRADARPPRECMFSGRGGRRDV